MTSPKSTPTRAIRKHTARELGERFGRTPRTIRRIIAEPREEYLARVQDNRKRARQMKAEGASIKEIQEALGVSRATAYRYVSETE